MQPTEQRCLDSHAASWWWLLQTCKFVWFSVVRSMVWIHSWGVWGI